MKIMGYIYKVRFLDKVEDDTIGQLRTRTLTIEIEKNLTQQTQISTMLHEIIEAINYHLDMKLPHNKIDILEAGLFQVLNDNGVDLSPLIKEIKEIKK